MLKLLFELLYFCEYGKIDHIAAKACNELTQGKLLEPKSQVVGFCF